MNWLHDVALAQAIVFAVGAVVAPIIILVHGAFWWRHRLKWAAIATLTSWIGLWLFLRDDPRANTRPSDRAGIRRK